MLNGFDFNTSIPVGNVLLLHFLEFCHAIIRWCNSEVDIRGASVPLCVPKGTSGQRMQMF